jgi:hypothetical protein
MDAQLHHLIPLNELVSVRSVMATLSSSSQDDSSAEGYSSHAYKERRVLKNTDAVEAADNPEHHPEHNHSDEPVE